MRSFSLYIFVFLVCFYSVELKAQGPPITVETPVMLGLEGSGIRTFGRIIQTENSKNYVHVIAIPYNISTKFQIGVIAPFISKTPTASTNVKGFGDLTLFAKHQLYKVDGTAKTFRVLAKVSQSFPTGNTEGTTPIGSGLYQTYVGLIAGNITSRVGIYGDLGYNITSKEVSDNLLYNFSVGVPLLPQKYPQKQLNAFLEWNGNFVLQNEVHLLLISPGLQFIPGRRLLLESSFQYPIFHKNAPNPTQWQWMFGIRFLIN